MKTALQDFLDSLDAAAPPEQSRLLQSVWHALKGDWQQAHDLVDEEPGTEAAWVHAWLHRIEGDQTNAGYWYRRARREPHAGSTTDEGKAIAGDLLARRSV